MEKRRERNSARTRQKLLDAATREFADKGFRGARIASIAARAQTNLQAIYHHFGSKEKLYIAVWEGLFKDDWFDGAAVDFHALEPAAALEAMIDALVERFRRGAHYPALFADENFNQARHIEKLEPVRALFDRIIAALREIMERGITTGAFRPGLDPLYVYMIISAEVGAYFSSMPVRAALFGAEKVDQKATAAWLEHLKRFVLRALQNESPSS